MTTVSPTRILLVDDESDIVRTLQFRLQAAGFEVLTAADGAQAVEMLSDEPVDLILSDFMMPEMNGIELTRTVKSNPRWFDTKVMLFSCNGDPEFRKRAIELGAVDYVSKTLGAGAILDKICALVGDCKPAPRATPRPEPSAARPEIRALARSLSDVLHLARSTGGVTEPALFALDSAQRIAEDIVRLAEMGDSE
jgi:CheY-like chemotaxis protein